MLTNEYSRTYHTYSRRKDCGNPLVARENISTAIGSTGKDYPVGISRSPQPGYSQTFKYFPSNRATVAGTFFGTQTNRFRERCSPSWTFSKDLTGKSYCYCQRHPAYNTSGCNPLEYPQYGQSTGSQQCHCPTHMERTQSKTSSGQNIQTQPRQTISGETLRYCRSLSKPTGESDCLLCRRKKPDSGTRTHSTITSPAARYSRKTNSRLCPARDHNVIRSPKHARWNCNRRLHAPAQTSGIYQVPANYQYKNSARFRSPSDRRQLWSTQTPTSSAVAKTPSPFSPAFHSYIQFLVEHGRTLVSRDNIKKNSSWLLQECKRTH